MCTSLSGGQVKYPWIWQREILPVWKFIACDKFLHLTISSSHLLSTSSPHVLTESTKAIHIFTLPVSIGRIYNRTSCAGNAYSDWHEDVGSNVCRHLLLSQCFLLSGAGLLTATLILSAQRLQDLGTFYQGAQRHREMMISVHFNFFRNFKVGPEVGMLSTNRYKKL